MVVGGELTPVSSANVEDCTSCHSAAAILGFPHQSRGHKLLSDAYVTSDPDHPNPADPWYTGDPQRQLPKMDIVCIGCHIDVGVEF